MPLEVVQIVLPLTFLGLCGLAGEILVQARRDRASREHSQVPIFHSEGPHSSRNAGKRAADTRS